MNCSHCHPQDDPCTNAGRGCNLTVDGVAECDASVAADKLFGAVGAVQGISARAHGQISCISRVTAAYICSADLASLTCLCGLTPSL